MQKAKGSERASRSLFFLGCIRSKGKAERSEGNPFCVQALQKAVLVPGGKAEQRSCEAIPLFFQKNNYFCTGYGVSLKCSLKLMTPTFS
jgi:hypothetical protein